ncbi:MAG: right-handed parallel beta-helix repeat-containing protein [Trueperaceae bacterium]|nr:right-handed parallel beta-helix repeat-containing protein [Trueperaceae bacterium]
MIFNHLAWTRRGRPLAGAVLTGALLTGATLLLAACGGGPPPAPSGLAAATEVAAIGAPLALTGLNLGSGGTVTVGGVTATTTSWTPTAIEATVPAGAPQGPQVVEVTTGGVTLTTTLFVGVDFPAGTLEELAALALPRGTAVRLGTGRFEASSPELVLDNLSLYGRGSASTTLSSSGTPGMLYFYGDDGYDLVMADLTLELTGASVVPSPLTTLAAAGSSMAATPGALDALTSAAKLPDLADLARATPAYLTAQDSVGGSLDLRDVVLRPGGGAPPAFFATATLTSPPRFYGGDVTLTRVTTAGATSGLMLLLATGGDITIEDSTLSAAMGGVASVFGQARVRSSELTIDGIASGPLQVIGARGLEITSSTLHAVDRDIMVGAGGGFLGSAVPLMANVTVTDSSLTATDADTADADDEGELVVMFGAGEISLAGNHIRGDRGVAFTNPSEFAALLTVTGNDFTVGATGIATASLVSAGSGTQVTTFSDNEVTFLSAGGSVFGGNQPSTTVTGNTFTGVGSAGTALTVMQAEHESAVDFRATDNVFTGFLNALALQANADVAREPFAVRINDNRFGFPIDAAPKAATLTNMAATLSDLDATRNVWGTNTSAATVATYVTATNPADPSVLQIAPITLP